MKRIILFRFHKRPGVCKNHLRLLRKFNPDTPIFGLFGGQEKDYKKFCKKLKPYLEDISCTWGKTDVWKWKHSDLAARLWFKEVGNKISFDMLHVIEWDLVFFSPLDEIYKNIPKSGIGLTSLTPQKEAKKKWLWFSQKKGEIFRTDWDDFLNYVKDRFNYDQEPYACLTAGLCMPRTFLEKYSSIEIPEILHNYIHDELRVPLFGQIFGFKLYDTNFAVGWLNEDDYNFFNCVNRPIWLHTMASELAKPSGRRVFHPVRTIVPFDSISYLSLPIIIKDSCEFCIIEIFHYFKKIIKKILKPAFKIVQRL